MSEKERTLVHVTLHAEAQAAMAREERATVERVRHRLGQVYPLQLRRGDGEGSEFPPQIQNNQQ